MNHRTLATSLLALATAAAAQSETSPKGYLTTEGSWSDQGPFGYYSTAYGYGTSYLQVDGSNAGQARSLKMLSLRRDGTTATNPTYLARTVKMSIRMAHADWSKVKGNTAQTEGEFLLAPWGTVLADKSVSLPDFTQQPASGTAPFNVLIPLDTPFAYNGADAFAFQILASPNAELAAKFTDYPVDYVYEGPSIARQGESGLGCPVTGKSQPLGHNSWLASHGPNGLSSWELWVGEAPASTPFVLVLGLANPALDFGACEKLFAWPDVTLSGTTGGSGSFEKTLEFPHRGEYVGATVYSQAAVYDAGKAVPVALSKGMSVVYPADPVQPKVARSSKLVHWGTPTWPTDHKFYRGTGLVFGLHE